MLRLPLILAFLLTALVVQTASSNAIERLIWKDLSPPIDQSQNPFNELDFHQKAHLQEIFWFEVSKKQGRPISASTANIYASSRKFLEDAGFNVERLLVRIELFNKNITKLQSTPVKRLDGKIIQLPGYILPLESIGNKVTEFLLVPFVGACIHTPPPPSNQIVHVQSQNGIEIKGLYDPVWVTGQMRIEQKSQSIELSDGSSEFEVGYALQATKIEPVKH